MQGIVIKVCRLLRGQLLQVFEALLMALRISTEAVVTANVVLQMSYQNSSGMAIRAWPATSPKTGAEVPSLALGLGFATGCDQSPDPAPTCPSEFSSLIRPNCIVREGCAGRRQILRQ